MTTVPWYIDLTLLFFPLAVSTITSLWLNVTLRRINRQEGGKPWSIKKNFIMALLIASPMAGIIQLLLQGQLEAYIYIENGAHMIGFDMIMAPFLVLMLNNILLWYFNKNKVNLVFLETGLGGAFDSVTACRAQGILITSISKDHEHILGKTLKNVPKYISMAQLTDDVLANAKSEIEAQLKAEGKPEQIWDKIVPGKIDRFVSDNTTLDQEMCLLDQNFIKDESKNVAEYISTYGDISVSSFKRVSLG
mgnify:CR=1 FL=1